jgi:lysozyme
MTPSQASIDLVRTSEGFSLYAYKDSAGVWTIGYGHTGKDVCEGMVWTEEQCKDALSRDLAAAGAFVEAMVKVPITQGQFDALTDLVFNEGVGRIEKSTLISVLNSGCYTAIPSLLAHQDADGTWHGWVYSQGQVLPGLITRRQAEIKLWNS